MTCATTVSATTYRYITIFSVPEWFFVGIYVFDLHHRQLGTFREATVVKHIERVNKLKRTGMC